MKYYLIGIKGTGMSSLATILVGLGNEVIGYDDNKEHKFTQDGLEEKEIPIYYDNSYPLTNEIVVYSAAFKSDHPELLRAHKLGLKIIKYNEAVGEITKQLKTICVSGCHGKTTTSAFLAHVLSNTIKTNYLIGDGTGYADKDNEYFVLESCEYCRHFLAYDPSYTIITNIELDHVDYYKDLNDMKDAYQSLLNNTKGLKVLCGDDNHIRSLKTDHKVIYYGFNDNNDLIAKNIELHNAFTTFDVYLNNEFYAKIKIRLFGKHMVLNTLAVLAISKELGIKKELILKELETFTGAKRRFNEKKVNGTIMIDDYAHHPTELKSSIIACQDKYPNKKIIALFLPNTYSRVEKFYHEFALSLNLADYVYLLDIAKGREQASDYPGISSNLILNEIKNGELITLNDAEKLLKHQDDILLFMSCQNIYILEERLEQLLTNQK